MLKVSMRSLGNHMTAELRCVKISRSRRNQNRHMTTELERKKDLTI